jgi:hypothetical protein
MSSKLKKYDNQKESDSAENRHVYDNQKESDSAENRHVHSAKFLKPINIFITSSKLIFEPGSGIVSVLT